jgi:hypothetical protein
MFTKYYKYLKTLCNCTHTKLLILQRNNEVTETCFRANLRVTRHVFPEILSYSCALQERTHTAGECFLTAASRRRGKGLRTAINATRFVNLTRVLITQGG